MPETLRSAGAPVVLAMGFYKHSAPLEPADYLGCGLGFDFNRVGKTKVIGQDPDHFN